MEILREIPEMIQTRQSSDPHADEMRAEIETYQEEGSKA